MTRSELKMGVKAYLHYGCRGKNTIFSLSSLEALKVLLAPHVIDYPERNLGAY